MSADVGREGVYAAEIAAFEGTSLETVAPFAVLVELASLITTANWWPRGAIEVIPSRSDAGSSSTRQRAGGAPVVRLAAPQMTPATLVHELAHVLAGLDHGHDAVFRRAQVDLTMWAFGEEPAAWLFDAYAAAGLDTGRRFWSEPPARSSPADTPVAL